MSESVSSVADQSRFFGNDVRLFTFQTISIANKPVPGVLDGRAKNKRGSTGVLLPGIEVKVMREDGTLAAVNEPGELHVRSGCVALGYRNNPKATKETFVDGWLRTGDRIRIDEDGVLL